MHFRKECILEDLLFKGMNIHNELRKAMDSKQNDFQLDEELGKAYMYGVNSTISTLTKLIEDDDKCFVVNVKNKQTKELTMQELSDIQLKRMLSYTE